METGQIYSIAKHAVNAIMSRTSSWWLEDREDATQEAALAILLASRRKGDKNRGYYYGAAKKGVYMWIRAWLRPRRNTFPLPAPIEQLLTAKTNIEETILRNLDSLAPLLRGQEVMNRKSAETEIALEIIYCRLMIEGYTIDQAAAKLNRTKRNTYALRERVIPKLSMITEGKRRKGRYAKPGPTSLAALRRLEQNPELLRRRNAMISAAKRIRDRAKLGDAYREMAQNI